MLERFEKSNGFKFTGAAAFFLLFLAGFLPQVFAGANVGILDIMKDSDALRVLHIIDRLPLADGLAAGIDSLLKFIFAMELLSICCFLLEGILALLLKRGAFPLVVLLGMAVNTTIRVIFTMKIMNINSMINDAGKEIIGHEPDLVQMSTGAMTIWVLLHLLLLALLILSLVARRTSENREAVFAQEEELIAEEPLGGGERQRIRVAFPSDEKIIEEKIVGDMKAPGKPKPAPPVTKPEKNAVCAQASAGAPVEEAFCGALAALTGPYRKKSYSLMPGETIGLGLKTEDTVEVVDVSEPGTLGQIRYDEEDEQYILTPMEMRTIYLKSGQPLGKNRFYTVPRGTEIYVVSRKNSFRLV